MENSYKFLAVNRNLKFNGLKQEHKNFLYENFKVIIRQPKNLPKDLVFNKTFVDKCEDMSINERQIIFHGVLIGRLSKKMYFMICTLLLLGEIDDTDFKYLPFRKGALKTSTLADGNLRKSLNDLKATIKEAIKKDCLQNQNYFNQTSDKGFDEKLFDKEFKNLAYNKNNRVYTNYQKAKHPDFLQRISKKSNEI